MPHFYLGQWEWRQDRHLAGEPYWSPPDADHIGLLDFRSQPQCAPAGGAGGPGLFVYASPKPRLAMPLGNNLGRILTSSEINDIEAFLGLAQGVLQATRLNNILAELVLQHGDPAGQTRGKPLRGGFRTGVTFRLAGQTIINDQFHRSHPAFANAIAVYQADYRRLRPVVGAGGLAPLQRMTGAMMQRLRVTDPALLLPPEHVDDGWLAPATIKGDTFAEASDANLDAHTATGPNGGWAWTENAAGAIQVNAAADEARTAGFGLVWAHADVSLSSDDHYVQALVGASEETDLSEVRVCCRKDPTPVTQTFYMVNLNFKDNALALFRRNAGAATLIASKAYTFTAGNTYTLKIQADSSDALKAFVNGVEELSQTGETNITGNTDAAIEANKATLGYVSWDDFEAADLPSGGFVHSRGVIIG